MQDLIDGRFCRRAGGPRNPKPRKFLLDGAPVIGPIVIRIGLRGNPAALLGTLTKAAGCYYLLRPCTVINGHLSLRQGNQTNPWHFGQVRTYLNCVFRLAVIASTSGQREATDVKKKNLKLPNAERPTQLPNTNVGT